MHKIGGIPVLFWALLFIQPSVVNAQTIADSTFYSMLDRGAVTVSTFGGSANLISGYARVVPGAGTTGPASFAILDYRKNNVLVAEGSIAGVRPFVSGRTFVEINARVNTAMSFVNTNGVQVTVTFQVTDENGNSTGPAAFTLNPGAQLAAFVSEFPFNLNSFTGTLSFSASSPIGVTALRTLTNQRGDFLMANQPIVTNPTGLSTPLVVSHFVDGGGWSTQLVLVNPTDQLISGTVQFFGEGTADTTAIAINMVVNGVSNSTFNYAIPSRSAVKFETSGSSLPLQAGSVRVAPSAGSNTPSGFAVLSLSASGVTVTQAVVGGEVSSSAFRMYVEASGTFGESGSIQSAMALSNPSPTAATINFELWTTGGVNTGLVASTTIPAFGHIARFFSDIFPGVALPFNGVLRTTAATSQVVMAGFRARYNERREFLITSTPPSNEMVPVQVGEVIIPQIADMGGYSTQFVLFSGTLSQSALGMLRFFNAVGQNLNLIFH